MLGRAVPYLWIFAAFFIVGAAGYLLSIVPEPAYCECVSETAR